MNEVRVITKFNQDLIQQHEEYSTGLHDRHMEITKRIIDLREEGVRKALISLGWTPPANPMQPLETAPKDGTVINLHRKQGGSKRGSWKDSSGSEFRTGFQWISTCGKFLDVSFNPVIGWSHI